MLKGLRLNIQSWKTKSNTLRLPKSITGNVAGNITTLSSLVDIIVTVIGQLFMIVSLGVLTQFSNDGQQRDVYKVVHRFQL